MSTIAWTCSDGPLVGFAAGFEQKLVELGYRPGGVRMHIQLMRQLNRWLADAGLAVGDLNPARVEQFLAACRASGQRRVPTLVSATVLLNYLDELGVVGAGSAPVETAHGRLLADYRKYLLDERGLTSATVLRYQRFARRFLTQRASLNGDVLGYEGLTSMEINDYLLAASARLVVESAKREAADLRSLLRFLYLRRLIDTDLGATMPPVAAWRGTRLPQGLRAADVEAVLNGCDRSTTNGRRDYAVLCLLARLGLRSGEVAALQLGDIDWRLGEILVRGKARRRDRLPLPADVGAALAAYLSEDWTTKRVPLNLSLTPIGWSVVYESLAAHVVGCSTSASAASRICGSCRRRLAEHGLGEHEIASLGPRGRRRSGRGPDACVVDGCGREWESARSGLCRAHAEQLRALPVADIDEFLAHRQTRPLAPCAPCGVAACTRQRRHPDGLYCDAHQQRLRTARTRDPHLDERRWRATEPAIGRGGEVSLRGVAPLVVAELLVGLQQRCRINAVKTDDALLRAFGNDLRRQQVGSIADYATGDGRGLEFTGLVNCLIGHARRALSSPETEVDKDEWDLTVFGHNGTVSFTGISQAWLRQAAKRWAADDLPKRRVRPGRRTSAGLSVRHHIGCLVRLSESLRMRGDRGEHPAVLGRADMEAFLHRLAYLESAGKISGDARIRACREVRAVLTHIRAMGLTRPGGIAAGLGEDFVIGQADVPAEPEPAEPNRDLPPEIMQQLCAHLDWLTSPEMRTAVELAIDTGRRPEEVCELAFDCLTRDDDGQPVLIYDNHKANRPARRLPIGEQTAAVILAQQQRVRARYPHTPVGELKLLPTDRRNPGGRRAITGFSLAFAHRTWVDRMPVLRTGDGIEYDKAKVVLYAYRHSYAQRHADAGVPVEVLRELLSHRKLETTSGYYRVGETRRRQAVDRVAAMQFDRHGNRIWRQAQALLDSEHARRAVGEVAVPFGVCAEPSNVKAGGGACPFRFRCAGCDHFRTDVSYLPDLHAYLDDLLRTRERLLATTDLDDWARAEAMPSEEEIRRIRCLIDQIRNGLDELDPEQRQQLEQAITVVRRNRSVMLGMPRTRQPLPDLRPERTP